MGQTTPNVFLSLKSIMLVEYYFQSPHKGVGHQHPENNQISYCIGLGAHFQSITTSHLSDGKL